METDNSCTNQKSWLFQPGQSGNPAGKPKGKVGGRAAALLELDAMMGTAENRQVLRKALQANFLNDPVRFFRQIIMPLLPTEVKMKLGEEGAVTWLSLSTTPRIQGNNQSMTRETVDSESSVAVDVGEKPLALPPNS